MYIQHILLFMLGMNVLLTTCRPHRGSGKYKFCGAHLIETLQLVCGHNGYQPPFWDVSTTEKLTLAHIINYKELNGAGIATECCHRGCSLQTLSSYCVDPRRKIRESDLFDLGSLGAELIPMGEDHSGDLIPKLKAAAPEVDYESMKRSAPVFGTVSPEYMRLPRTLDEVPEPFRGFQSGF